jgi:hypothetical protein
MARGSQERELEFIASAKETTGHTIEDWMTIVADAGLVPKTNTLIKYLKTAHDLNHLQASTITGIYLNDGKPVYNYEVLFANLFDGKDHLVPIYDALKAQVTARFDDVVFIPTKAYISIEGKKIFGCAKLTAKTIRYGLDLGDKPFDGRVQKAKGLGAMPNISHMIELASADDIDDEVLQLTDTAFDIVHS